MEVENPSYVVLVGFLVIGCNSRDGFKLQALLGIKRHHNARYCYISASRHLLICTKIEISALIHYSGIIQEGKTCKHQN